MSRISGMTGFGRADGADGDWSWSVEARSVNGRNLEVRFRGPPGFDTLERLAKASAQARLNRGQVTLGVQAKRRGRRRLAEGQSGHPGPLSPTGQPTGRGWGDAAVRRRPAELARRAGSARGSADDADARAAVEARIAASIDAALDALKLSREREGEQLAPVVTGFIDRIEALVAQAETEAVSPGRGHPRPLHPPHHRTGPRRAGPGGSHLPGGRRPGDQGGRARGAGSADRPRRLGPHPVAATPRRTETRLPDAGIHEGGEHPLLEIGYDRRSPESASS
jgi:hypothetical protein